MDAMFQQAVSFLPPALRTVLCRLPEAQQQSCEELRLRVGRPLCGASGAEEWAVSDGDRPVLIRQEDLLRTVEIATEVSFHTALEKLRSGFLPLPGGHRLGLCGTAVVREGEVVNFRVLSSLALRIAREAKGIAEPLIPQLRNPSGVENTLILAPPGYGKTTLLRDLVRGLSDGTPPLRIGLADERGEVAALCGGCPQRDVGGHTDVIDGCPKQLAMLMLLRGMTPQVLAVDEITAPEDVEAMLCAAGCGVSLLATVHGESAADLMRRPLYRRLLEAGVFQKAVSIHWSCGVRSYQVEALT